MQGVITRRKQKIILNPKINLVIALVVILVLGLLLVLFQSGYIKRGGIGEETKVIYDDIGFPQYPNSKVTRSSKTDMVLEIADSSIPMLMTWYFDSLNETGWVVEEPPEDALSEEFQSMQVRKETTKYILKAQKNSDGGVTITLSLI